MNELLKDIVYTIKVMCDNELEEDAILNMFFAKFGSVVACKNILTDSSRHVKPLPVAYYALNFLPSGGNKTKPYKIISGFYDWLNEEYKTKNELNKISYIEEKLFNLDEKAKKKYEEMYGPLTAVKSMDCDRWAWADVPLPWEGVR